jgi:WD40 repeat protein
VTFSSDGSHVVSGSLDHTIGIWDAQTGELKGIFSGHSDSVSSVAFSRNSSCVASGSRDRTVRIWDVGTGESERIFEGHSNWVNYVAFSSDGSQLVSGSHDKTIRLWNVATGESKNIFEGHSNSVSSVSFSNDGTRIVSGSYDNTIRVWNALTGELEGVLKGHSDSVTSVAFSIDGSHIVSGSRDKTVQIWNAVVGDFEGVVEVHSNCVNSVAISKDGSRVASGSDDETVRIWDAVTGEPEGIFKGHSGWESAGSSSDGNRTAVRFWNMRTGFTRDIVGGDLGPVLSVAFLNDGLHVLCKSSDTVRVWDRVTGKLQAIFVGPGPTSSVHTVRLSDRTEIEYRPNIGFVISTAVSDQDASPSCFLSNDKSWIQTNSSQRGCWVPQRYRGFTCTHFIGLKMAFGFRSGSVVVIDLQSGQH